MTKNELVLKALEQIKVTDGPGEIGEYFSDAMDEYAKQQAIAFDTWRIENRWFSFEQGHYYHTFEQGTLMSDKNYNKHYVKTREQLYDQFIEQQNK